MAGLPAPRFDATAFLEWERRQEVRHEWMGGEVRAMAGGTPSHAATIFRLAAILGRSPAADRCTGFSADLKVGIEDVAFLYPDLTWICGPVATRPGADDVVTNPTVVFEVLSPSTRDFDRGAKFDAYARIASLRAVVYIDFEAERIEIRERTGPDAWTIRYAVGPGAVATLADPPLEMAVGEVCPPPPSHGIGG